MMNKKVLPENRKCTLRSRQQGVTSLSASPRLLQKRKGVEQRGSPWAITLKLWSCSFMVSCRAFSSWVHRVCASATRSSLKKTNGRLKCGQCELSKSNILLCTSMLKGFWKDFKNWTNILSVLKYMTLPQRFHLFFLSAVTEARTQPWASPFTTWESRGLA